MNYRVRFHPLVARDLDAIALWIRDYAGPDAAARKLVEIEAAIATLKTAPNKERPSRTVQREACLQIKSFQLNR